MEKGDYSIADIKELFNITNFKIGEILYFRNDNIIQKYGSMYDIEIKVEVVGMDGEKLNVICNSYYNNNNKKIELSFNTPHFLDKRDFKFLYKYPKYF